MQSSTRRSRSPAEIQELVEVRSARMVELLAMAVVDLKDVDGLDRGGMTLVANDLWPACTTELRKALLNHEHHFVRSCASISNVQLEQMISGSLKDQPVDTLKTLMRDLERQGDEMAADSKFQELVSVAGSAENKACAALNVRMHEVRSRLNALGYQQSRSNRLMWI